MCELTKNPPPELVLASSSAYRQAQMAQLQLTFRCEKPHVDETPSPEELPRELAIRLSIAKAQAVAANCGENTLVIAGDQCASLGQTILGKPGNYKAAIAQLKACSDQEAIFYSGLCVIDNRSELSRHICVETKVSFRLLSEQNITRYVNREPAFDCAGSFKYEGLGISLFSSIQSEDPSALRGLPLIALNTILMDLGASTLNE